MKKPLKIFVYFILSIIILLVILVMAASLSQRKIVDMALKEISESIHVPLEIEDLSFTFIKRFPFATVELSGVKIGGIDSMGTNGISRPNEDILNVKSVFVSVKTIPLFIGNIDIIKIEINDATLNYKVDSLGKSNIEALLSAFAKDTLVNETSGTLPTLNLKKVILEDITIFYADNLTNSNANLFFPSLEFAGKFANDNYNGNIEGDVQLSKCSYASTKLNQMDEASFDFKLDYKSDTLQIQKFEANTDGANIEVTGWMTFENNLFADLKVESNGLEVEKLLKYAPDSLPGESIIKELFGTMHLSSTLKVNVSDSIIPSFNLALDSKDGNTKINEYPTINNLSFEGKFSSDKERNNKTNRLIFKRLKTKNDSKREETSIDFKIDYNSDTLQIKKLVTNADGSNLEITGKLAFANNLYTDLNLESKGLNLGKLINYVPESLFDKYGIEDINGIMRFSGTVIGNVSDTILPAINLAFDLKNGNTKIKEYPEIHAINFNGKFSNGIEKNNKTSSLNLSSFYAETDSSKIDLSMFINNIDKPNYTLNSTLNINIEEFKDLIPDSLIQSISGKIIADISTKGEMPDSIDDNFIDLVVNSTSANLDFSNFNMVRDSFEIKNFSGLLIYFPGQLSMNNFKGSVPDYEVNLINSSFNAEFTGSVMQPQNLEIHFKNFNIESKQGKFWGSAKIENLKHPDFNVDASANLNLKMLKPFLPDTLVKSISGNLSAKINSHGKLNLDSIAEQSNEIVFKQSKLTFNAQNISLTMADTLQKLTNLSGFVKMGGDTVFISKMSGIASGIDFSIDSTTIVNIYEAVMKNQYKTVFGYGNIKFGAVDYSILAPFAMSESSENTNNINSTDAKTNVIEPRNFKFDVKGKFAAKSFKHEKIFIENISAKFNLSDSVYIIDQLKANAFDGTSNSSIRFSIVGNGKQIINIKNVVNRMDINKFMYAFDNFGYDSLISYKNIQGLVSADLNSRFVFNADTLVSEDMRVNGDLTLENGRIINYQPAMDVASFTGIKELDNIELKTLKSNLFIFKNQMYVPSTDVVSSSMDFSVFGMQSFGDNYEYHMQLHLGDVLKGKSKKLIERQSSTGDEVSKDDMDRSTIKIIYADIDGKAKAGFDNKKAIKAMELKIQVQQKMLDLIFHPKLVSFETGVK